MLIHTGDIHHAYNDLNRHMLIHTDESPHAQQPTHVTRLRMITTSLLVTVFCTPLDAPSGANNNMDVFNTITNSPNEQDDINYTHLVDRYTMLEYNGTIVPVTEILCYHSYSYH